MRDSIGIGPAPVEEPCVQVRTDEDYMADMRFECEVYRRQLLRESPPPGNARLVIRSNPHDFGSYMEVVAIFDDEDEDETDWALGLEGESPSHWDAIAKEEISKHIYKCSKS